MKTSHILGFPGSRLCDAGQHAGGHIGASEDQPRMCRKQTDARLGREGSSSNLSKAPGGSGRGLALQGGSQQADDPLPGAAWACWARPSAQHARLREQDLHGGGRGGTRKLLPAGHLRRLQAPTQQRAQCDSGRWCWAEGFVESGFLKASNQNSS